VFKGAAFRQRQTYEGPSTPAVVGCVGAQIAPGSSKVSELRFCAGPPVKGAAFSGRQRLHRPLGNVVGGHPRYGATVILLAAATTTTIVAISGGTSKLTVSALAVALVAAAASITGAVVTVVSNRRSEHRRWVRDERAKVYTTLATEARLLRLAAADWLSACAMFGFPSTKESDAQKEFIEALGRLGTAVDSMELVASLDARTAANDISNTGFLVLQRMQQLFNEPAAVPTLTTIAEGQKTFLAPLDQARENFIGQARKDLDTPN
jgi:hypothetical protein